MSLLYRAIWQVTSDNLLEISHQEFTRWVRSKHPGLSLSNKGEGNIGGVETLVDQGSSEVGSIKRWKLREDNGQDQWITTFTALQNAVGSEQWIWIDLENVSTAFLRQVNSASPKLARHLLAALPSSCRGSLSLSKDSIPLDVKDIDSFISSLKNPDRDLPLIVFSPNLRLLPQRSIDRVEKAANSLAGLGQVHLIMPDAIQPFRNAVGRDLNVWAGACRIYMPKINLESPNPRHHQQFEEHQLGRRLSDAGLRIFRYLSPYITRQRAPQIYNTLRGLLESQSESLFDELSAEYNDLDELYNDLQGKFEDVTLEAEILNNDLDTAHRNYRQVWTAIKLAGVSDVVKGHLLGETDTDNRVLDKSPNSCAEAVELARRTLKSIRFPKEVCHDLDQLDQETESTVWAKAAWRGFVALNHYAERPQAFSGGFWEWCQSDNDATARSWPATSKKLAMRESESVRNNEHFRNARILPVSTQVEPSGKIYMEAHLKIAQGGGPLAPRIYFYDDTRGKSGKIHIAFFGRHRYMPNTRTN